MAGSWRCVADGQPKKLPQDGAGGMLIRAGRANIGLPAVWYTTTSTRQSALVLLSRLLRFILWLAQALVMQSSR